MINARSCNNHLNKLHLTEGRGTGIPTVIRAMQENGSPLPTFDTDEGRTYFTATLPVHPHSTRTVTPQVTPQVTLASNAKMRLLLGFCVSPRDRASVLARLSLKDRKNLRERYLLPAIAEGWLTGTDPLHPNSPTQKYRTTPKGIAALNDSDNPEAVKQIGQEP